MTGFAILAIVLIGLRCAAQLGLNAVNSRHVLAHADAVPEAFHDIIDPPTYDKSVRYTLAKSRLGRFEVLYDAAVLLLALFSGILPWSWELFANGLGLSAWSMAAWLWVVGFALTLPSLPIEWHSQFHLEERFGFNTTTPQVWWMDRLKGILLGAVIGYPLLALILRIMEWTGSLWWLWAWAALMAFQSLMLVLAPVVIMPLVQQVHSASRRQLARSPARVGARTGFRAQSIQGMDGSKRSRHSNAFFMVSGSSARLSCSTL